MTAGRRAAGLETSDVADGIVVYRPADDTMHHLNAVAAVVFELCDGRTREDLASRLAWLFALTPDETTTAVDQAMTELTARNLIR
jgi:coenzyme PQQ synthesis protein D (PqqD)